MTKTDTSINVLVHKCPAKKVYLPIDINIKKFLPFQNVNKAYIQRSVFEGMGYNTEVVCRTAGLNILKLMWKVQKHKYKNQ